MSPSHSWAGPGIPQCPRSSEAVERQKGGGVGGGGQDCVSWLALGGGDWRRNQGQGNQCQTLNVLKKDRAIPEKVLISPEKVLRKSQGSPGKVQGKSQESPERVTRKSQESPEKFLRKS